MYTRSTSLTNLCFFLRLTKGGSYAESATTSYPDRPDRHHCSFLLVAAALGQPVYGQDEPPKSPDEFQRNLESISAHIDLIALEHQEFTLETSRKLLRIADKMLKSDAIKVPLDRKRAQSLKLSFSLIEKEFAAEWHGSALTLIAERAEGRLLPQKLTPIQERLIKAAKGKDAKDELLTMISESLTIIDSAEKKIKPEADRARQKVAELEKQQKK